MTTRRCNSAPRRTSLGTRKLSFLGFAPPNAGGGGGGRGNNEDDSDTVYLDDEMEDVFRIANDTPAFNLKQLTSSNTPLLYTQSDMAHDEEPVSLSDQINAENGNPISTIHYQQAALNPDFPDNATGDKRVQFDGRSSTRSRRKSRHQQQLGPGHRARKFSLQEEPQWKRRVSIQPEDSSLAEADIDDLDSHRSDDPKALRRSKIQKPGSDLIKISRKSGNANLRDILSPSHLKKMYDRNPHAPFVQLAELVGTGDDKEWRERARWIKYEEDVEEGSDRWGRPHVATLSFHSLLNLRRCLQSAVFLLDLDEKDIAGVAYRITEQMVIDELIAEEDKTTVMRALLLKHKHVHQHEKGFRFNVRKHSSYSSLQNLTEEKLRRLSSVDGQSEHGESPSDIKIEMKEETYLTASQEELKNRHSESILKRIPPGAEATVVLVGTVDFLEQPTIAFVRLAQGVLMPTMTEVPIPVRFMFVLMGPGNAELDYHEVGRSISTLMSHASFHQIAYKAEGRKDLLSAINEFLDESIVLPPGNWNSQALLPFEELQAKSSMILQRKKNALNKIIQEDTVEKKETEVLVKKDDYDNDKKRRFNPLVRTGKPFGGLINDIKNRLPHYWSDFTDGLNGQCMAAAIFMYFAALSSAITFGGLISGKTENLIGLSETLLATSVAGVLFSIFSCQPMMIVGTTGPLLLVDESLFAVSKMLELDYLTVRLYSGFWMAIISAVVALVEGSVFVKLFTRFTEDIFSSLISLIFILEPVMNLVSTYKMHPLGIEYCAAESLMAANIMEAPFDAMTNETQLNIEMLTASETQHHEINQPNTALFSTLLTLGTFAIAYFLRIFRNSKFLGRSARRALGDFGVPIALVSMVLLDYLTPNTYTEKLNVPEGLSPSKEGRSWLVPPMGSEKPFPIWAMFGAALPAIMLYIIVFMETNIAELIVDKPERNLKKGSGFHMDIMLISFINIISGLIGAPWMCVATVRSVSHVSALTLMSQTHAPGDKPYIAEVKEQRLSALAVSILVGASVTMAVFLKNVPLSVLFGIFLYMGISSMNGIQLFERFILLFVPVKHHPPVPYVRRVHTWKMHLFTLIQISCLGLLWIVKSSAASLVFPFLLVMMIPLRSQLKFFFSDLELRALDGKQPELNTEDEPDFYQQSTLAP